MQQSAPLSKNQKKRLKKKLKKIQLLEADDKSKDEDVTDSLVTGRPVTGRSVCKHPCNNNSSSAELSDQLSDSIVVNPSTKENLHKGEILIVYSKPCW